MYGFPLQPEASLLESETITFTVPLQLSVSSIIALISAVGMSAIHCKPVISVGAVAVGAIVSSIV